MYLLLKKKQKKKPTQNFPIIVFNKYSTIINFWSFQLLHRIEQPAPRWQPVHGQFDTG